MIFNATIIGYTGPSHPNARGQMTLIPSESEVSIRCCVSEPTRAQMISAANKISGITDVIYVPIIAQDYTAMGGQLRYTLDNIAGEHRAEILSRKPWSHGEQTHIELMTKAV